MQYWGITLSISFEISTQVLKSLTENQSTSKAYINNETLICMSNCFNFWQYANSSCHVVYLLQYFILSNWFGGMWVKIEMKWHTKGKARFPNHIPLQFSLRHPLTQLKTYTKENKLPVTKQHRQNVLMKSVFPNALMKTHQRFDFLFSSIWLFAYLWMVVSRLPKSKSRAPDYNKCTSLEPAI